MSTVQESRNHFIEQRQAPRNLASQDAPLFAAATSMRFPDCKVQHLREADVFGRSPIRLSDGQFFPESFVNQSHFDLWKKQRGHWRAGVERFLHYHTQLDTPGIWITDNWSCGFFHWFGDALARLELAFQELPAQEVTLLLPHKFHRHDYFLESLKAYGLRDVRVLGRFECMRCTDLFFPQHIADTGNYNTGLMHAMRSRFRQHIDASKLGAPSSRLYISRRLAGRRRIVNEAEILGVLADHGFQTLLAEETPWEQQVKLVAKAEFLLSNHGAGLTNMLAMEAGTRVMEIREREDQHNNCFFTLASTLGLGYYYLLADRHDPTVGVHLADLVVDPERLNETLHMALNPTLKSKIA
ncbi:glycosyltransferase family 61 protein [bacterium]|nr:glycosyltransferase family 61 protein [bacterium]